MKNIIAKLHKPLNIVIFSCFISIINLLFYNLPLFRFAYAKSNPGLCSVVFVVVVAIAMCLLNFIVIYLLLFCLRYVGRVFLSILFVLNAICTFFVVKYHTFITSDMLGNVFGTKASEATMFLSLNFFLWVIVLGILPAIYILIQKVNYSKLKNIIKSIVICLALSSCLLFAYRNKVLWISNYDTELGALIMPYSYIVNTCRYYAQQAAKNRKEILLPKGNITDNKKSAVVLVIGESARRANFSLYGYNRNTNPKLSKREDLALFKANSDYTYTIMGVKNILEYKKTPDLYEILPNYLNRSGVDVAWRTSNWGEPPVHFSDYKTKNDMAALYPNAPKDYDGILLEGLKDRILSSKQDKVFIVLHTYTSHGPKYCKNYPKEFEVFKPVCTNVENAKDSIPQLVNAYDNSIVYTDYLLNNIIDSLGTLKQWNTAMIYVSDHGESLGENDLYMHGLQKSLAPKEQYEIPFIVWTSPGFRQLKPISTPIDQHYVFHSVLNLLSVDSPIYNKDVDIFLKPQK